MSSILVRIKEYIDSKGVTIAAFERSIGMSNASFGKSLKKGGSIGSDKIEKILKVYPEISSEWLLTGTGSMRKSATEAGIYCSLETFSSPQMGDKEVPYSVIPADSGLSRDLLKAKDELILSKNLIIKDKEAIIELLEQRVSQLEKELESADYVVTAVYSEK